MRRLCVAELIEQPQRWDIRFIRRFMLIFGSLSSLFDFLTFGVLLFVLHATPEQFRTGWFIESVISATLTVFAMRSRRPFFQSVPGEYLFLATMGIIGLTVGLPWSPIAASFGLVPLPSSFLGVLGLMWRYISSRLT